MNVHSHLDFLETHAKSILVVSINKTRIQLAIDHNHFSGAISILLESWASYSINTMYRRLWYYATFLLLPMQQQKSAKSQDNDLKNMVKVWKVLSQGIHN